MNLCTSTTTQEVILSVLKGHLANPDQTKKKFRANIILDTFSDKSYITSHVAKKLGLSTLGCETVTQSTLDNQVEKTYQKTNVELLSPQKNITVNVFVTDNIISLRTDKWKNAEKLFPNLRFKGLESPGSVHVDLLVGMDFMNLIRGTEIIRVGELEARSSLLGYYLEGRFNKPHNEESNNSTILAIKNENTLPMVPLEDLNYKESPCTFADFHEDRIEARIQNFFSDGDFTEKQDHDSSKEELLKKLNDGTRQVKTETGEILYEVPMLWRDEKSKTRLRPNFPQVLAFLNSNTKRLEKDNMIQTFDNIIQEGIKQGIYEVVPTDPTRGHHIPTFGALNPNSTSTPVRLVLACNLPIGASVNSELETGPSLIRDLPTVLRQFRCRKIGVTGDISKAFHRLVVREEDRDCFRFLWWAPGKIRKEVLTLRLARVPIGTNLAPFQFLGTLAFHLSSHADKEVAGSILDKFYADNMVFSIDDAEPLEYILNAVRVLKDGGFDLRKFSSSSKSLNQELRKHDLFNEKEPSQTRILGMVWSFYEDNLTFSKPSKSRKGPITSKREALQTLMSHFDPLGLLSALIMPLTSQFSKFCERYTWDEKLSKEDMDNWNELYIQLTEASKVSIPRHHELDSSKVVRLAIFTDATGTGWGGACAYLVQNGKSYLVAGKAKLPPKRLREKGLSVPKRELEAIVIGGKMLSKLMETYKDFYTLEPHIFSDSQIVLNWVSNKTKVNQFVDNRVRLFNKLVGETPLHFIETHQNPADYISRGMSAREYLDKKHILWTGPAVMHEKNIEKFKPEQANEAEIGAITMNTITEKQPSLLNLIRDCRTLAEAKRLVSTLISCTRKWRKLPPLGPNKLAGEATRKIIKAEQEQYLSAEISYLTTKTGPVPPNVRNMQLFLDKNSILRVGGRLAHASIGWAQKYPILLSRDSPLLPLRIQEIHETIKHGGPGLTKTAIQQLYWIPRVSKLIPKILSKCYKCRKATGPPLRPPGPPALPPERATLDPMTVIGVDLTGHFNVRGQNNQVEKAYLAFFTCCSTRYINIEYLTNMSTECFLQAFRRHCSRFAIPRRIWSDNATNFVKSADVLGEKLGNEFLTEIGESMNQRGLDWKFNIVSAPWQGGHFERLIGVVKALLKRVCGRQVLQKDELWTLSKEVQAICNERPYGVHPTNHKDRTVLTPNLVVFGRSLNPLPYGENEITDDDDDPTYVPDETQLDSRWRRQANRMSQFREQFSQEYFQELRQRHIYDHRMDPNPEANIQIKTGDLVIMQSDIRKRSLWELAEVTGLVNSQTDGKIRAAHLRTKEGTTTRPLQKIYPLMDADKLRPTQTELTPDDNEGDQPEGTQSPIPPPVSVTPSQQTRRPRRKAAESAAAKITNQLRN